MADQSPGGTPPTGPERPGTEANARPDAPAEHPFVVEAAPAVSGRRSRLPVVFLAVGVAAIGVLSTWGLLAGPRPPPAPTPAAEVASSPPAAVVPVATLALPAPDGDGLPSVAAATEDDAFAILATAGGWRQCPMWRGLGDGITIRPEDAAAAMAASDRRRRHAGDPRRGRQPAAILGGRQRG